jgi:peptide/nickel transport system permease protein
VVVTVVYVLQALPNFWVALVLIMVLAVRMPIFPPFGRGGIETFVLPALSLALPIAGRVTRFVRAGLLRVMPELYIRTAYSKGLSTRVIYLKHAFRNALIPLVTDLSMQFVWTIGNAIVIEMIFGWAGIGRLTMTAIGARDYPTVQGCVLLFAAMFMIVNLLVDLTYLLIDPRIDYK